MIYLIAGSRIATIPSWLVGLVLGASLARLIQIVKSGQYKKWFGW